MQKGVITVTGIAITAANLKHSVSLLLLAINVKTNQE